MTNEIFRCIFFHKRSCPLREQMEWNDEKLRSEDRDYNTFMDADKNHGRGSFLKPLDYLMHFCDRCPHMRRNTKLEAIIDILNVANPVSEKFRSELEEKMKSYL